MVDRRRDRREKQEVRRRGLGRAKRAQADRAEKTETDRRRETWEKRRLKRRLAYVLMVLGALVGVSHVLEHMDVFEILPNPTAQDLLLGYPTAGLLIVVGLVLLPAEKY